MGPATGHRQLGTAAPCAAFSTGSSWTLCVAALLPNMMRGDAREISGRRQAGCPSGTWPAHRKHCAEASLWCDRPSLFTSKASASPLPLPLSSSCQLPSLLQSWQCHGDAVRGPPPHGGRRGQLAGGRGCKGDHGGLLGRAVGVAEQQRQQGWGLQSAAVLYSCEGKAAAAVHRPRSQAPAPSSALPTLLGLALPACSPFQQLPLLLCSIRVQVLELLHAALACRAVCARLAAAGSAGVGTAVGAAAGSAGVFAAV